MEKKDKKYNAKKGAFKTRLALLTLVSAIIAVLMSQTVLAQNVFQRMGGGISGYFSNYATTTGPTFLDLFIFFVVFFALCWIGFNQVFKDAKNANIALSSAVGAALAVALVYGGQFTLRRYCRSQSWCLHFSHSSAST